MEETKDELVILSEASITSSNELEGEGNSENGVEGKKTQEKKKTKKYEQLEKKIRDLKLKNKELKKKNTELQLKLQEYEKMGTPIRTDISPEASIQKKESEKYIDESNTILERTDQDNENEEKPKTKQKILKRSTSQEALTVQRVNRSMENLDIKGASPQSTKKRGAIMGIRKTKPRNSLIMNRESGEQDQASDKIVEADLRSLHIKSEFDGIIAKLEGDENKKLRLRMKAIQELLLTEADYIRDLEVIVQIWLVPLRENNILKPMEINSIFSNLELIYGINQILMEDLMRKVDEHTETNFVDCNFGDVFLDIGNFLKMYIQYVSNHEKSIETYENCRKQSQFANFQKACEARSECRNLNLISFLVKPIQRVCKYPLLLKELLNLTPEDHPDYGNLKKAIERLGTVTITINEGKRHEENQRKTMDIVKKLVGIDPEEIVIPTRRFIQEADFTKISKGRAQVRHFFLFNDLIVYAKLVSKRKEIYQFKDKLSLETTICGNLPNSDKFQYAFELTRVDQKIKKYIICTDSEETKANWMQIIMKQHKEAVNLGEKLQTIKNKETTKT